MLRALVIRHVTDEQADGILLVQQPAGEHGHRLEIGAIYVFARLPARLLTVVVHETDADDALRPVAVWRIRQLRPRKAEREIRVDGVGARIRSDAIEALSRETVSV